MKLEHLLKAYKLNNINAEIKDVNNEIERAGVITFANGISASYLLDDEDIVIAMKIFFNCLITDEKGTIQTNTFNSVGDTETKTIVDNNESYGKNCYYGNSNQTKNKLIFEEDMMKFMIYQ